VAQQGACRGATSPLPAVILEGVRRGACSIWHPSGGPQQQASGGCCLAAVLQGVLQRLGITPWREAGLAPQCV
jgi:hypothetical protein